MTRTRSYFPALQLIGLIVCVIVGGFFFLHAFAERRNVELDAAAADRLSVWVNELNAAKPDYILIGDSMLSSRMDPGPLSALLGKKCYFYCRGGGSSAAWYLYFKNVILRSKIKPRAIIFIFRNEYLTWPRFRVDGIYRANLDRSSLGADKLVTKLLKPDPPSPWDWVGWTRRWLVEPGGIFYTGTASTQFHNRLENIALDLTSFGQKKDDRRVKMANRFNLASLRSDLQAELPAEGSSQNNPEYGRPKTFDPSPDKSFLPHIVSLAKENGILPVFFRVKCRPNSQNITFQTPQMLAYNNGLRAWMKAQHCLLFDETNDPKITLNMYQDGDHILDAYKPFWTQYFCERVGPSLP